MQFTALAPQLWGATHRGVNVFAIVHNGATVLIDSGVPAAAGPLLHALRRLPPVHDLVITHAHYDHSGAAAALQAATGATVWAHPSDAQLLAAGRWRRQVSASPTFHGRLGTWVVNRTAPEVVAAIADCKPAREGNTLPIGGGIAVIEAPGHSAGQIALRWRAPDRTEVLFAADTVVHLLGLREPLLYEDRAAGIASIVKLAQHSRSVALMVFGHGAALGNPAEPLARFAEKLSSEA